MWGRDTLIALPGLYLVQGELEAARGILGSLIKHMADGLVPNRIPDAGEGADYHTADATLWLFEAARLYAEQAGSSDPFLRGRAFRGVGGRLRGGPPAGPGTTFTSPKRGSLRPADPGFALTWMDAKVGTEAVTPRAGLAGRAAGLVGAGAATRWRRSRRPWASASSRGAHAALTSAQGSRFARRFWCEKTGYPYDVVSDDPQALAVRDARIRPNAVIALAVEPRLFDAQRAESISAVAKRELVTPAACARWRAPPRATAAAMAAG